MTLTSRFWRLPAALALVLIGCGPEINVASLSPQELAQLQRDAAGVEQRGYRIQPGDSLAIRFPYHQEMDQEAIVRPDGKSNITGLGPVTAAGLTAAELETQLKERTSTRLRNPEVVVNIAKFGDRPVYVGGEVGRPGMLVYRKGLTPLQAVMAAGGFLPSARIDSVILVRPAGLGEPYMARKLDLGKVVNEGEREPLGLLPDDVIFVPRTPIANANVWVRQHVTELLPFIRMSTPMPGL